MKFLRLLFCLLLSLPILHASPAGPSKDVIHAAHKTTHQIAFRTLLEAHGCSATAVGHHALLTATHCELGTDTIGVDGKRYVIKDYIRDGLDHTILLVQGPAFENVADFAEKAEVSDDVFVWGNPSGLTDFFRRGTFSGVKPPQGLAALFGAPPSYLFDFNGFNGDSGAAIFNDEGKIIDVVSVLETLKQDDDSAHFIGGYPIVFSKADLERAKSFDTPAVPTLPPSEDEDN